MVSIHAPAWGATRKYLLSRYSQYVSIHAPAWGATSPPRWSSLRLSRFQSTHPRGVRPGKTAPWMKAGRVSIHAPAWGATCCRIASRDLSSLFQSTHPRGVRLDLDAGQVVIGRFQSTHPRGVRHGVIIWGNTLSLVSIHAPAWGATFLSKRRETFPFCFNPRTRVGCDPAQGIFGHTPSGFNPRTRVGCDQRAGRAGHRIKGFNPRTRVGCDAKAVPKLRDFPGFNPRTRVGCDAWKWP